jgi:hypothetical protein
LPGDDSDIRPFGLGDISIGGTHRPPEIIGIIRKFPAVRSRHTACACYFLNSFKYNE